MKGILVDAGPLVAILNARDNDHEICVSAFRAFHAPLTTTWSVITEAAYLLGHSIVAQEALFGLIERGAVNIALLDGDDLPFIRKLMRTYHDLPMDLADATLVHLAMKTGTDTVFTLDSRDFSVYRLGKTKSIRIVPL